jgi:hypothetical protein
MGFGFAKHKDHFQLMVLRTGYSQKPELVLHMGCWRAALRGF